MADIPPGPPPAPLSENAAAVQRFFRGKLADERYVRAIFHQLVTRYRTLQNIASNPEARGIADRLAAQPPERVNWNDVYEFEHVLLCLWPDDQLGSEAIRIAEEFREVAGGERFERLRADLATQDPPLDSLKLRPLLLRLQAELHGLYVSVPQLERLRNGSFNHFIVAIVVLILGVMIVSIGLKVVPKWLELDPLYLPQVAAYACIGAIGSAVSKLMRLTRLPTGATPRITMLQVQQVKAQLFASMCIGATAAVFFYCACVSGLLAGDIFPSLPLSNKPLSDSSALSDFWKLQLVDKALGKMVVWAFLSGFSERLFEDTVDRIVGESKKGRPNLPNTV